MFGTYDIGAIDAALEDFYWATDININLLDSDFSYIGIGRRINRENNLYCECVKNTVEGRKGCWQSDNILLKKCKETRKLQMRVCHAGLIDAAMPILYDDEIIGYIIFGKMKPDTEFDTYIKYIEKIGLDPKKMKEYYQNIPTYEYSKIQGIANIAVMLAKYILLEKMLSPSVDDVLEKAVNYINNNIDSNLNIYKIAKEISVSKNIIYKRFHKHFNMTVGEYITERRINKSVGLLESTDLSIEEISQKVGFASASYYSKAFKKLKGIPPLKYKKINVLKTSR